MSAAPTLALVFLTQNQNSALDRSEQAAVLEPGTTVEGTLQGGETRSYEIHADAGMFLHAIVEQLGIDVALTLYAPDGKKIASMYNPSGTSAPNQISTITESAGIYRLEVAPGDKNAAGGRYRVTIHPLRAPLEKDRGHIRAERLFVEAEVLLDQGNSDSYLKAVEKFAESMPLWQAAGENYEEALALLLSGGVQDRLGERQKAVDSYLLALPLWRAVGDRAGEGATLHNLGSDYDALGDRQKALKYLSEALPVERAAGDRTMEAATLDYSGYVYQQLGDTEKALDYYSQALLLKRAIEDRAGVADSLYSIGSLYAASGAKQQAIDNYNQALVIERSLGNRSLEAKTLHGIGSVHDDSGERQEALDYYNSALSVERALGDGSLEATTLHNIASVYDALGEKQKALDYYNQALPLERALGDRSREATTLNNIGSVYDGIGEEQTALDYYNQALPLERAVGDRSGEARTLSGIGLVFSTLGEKQKALDYYNQALPLQHATGDRKGEAATLHDIGLIFNAFGEKQKALDYFNQALLLERAVGDHSNEAGTLTAIGLVYSDLGEKQKALDYYNQALPMERAAGNRSAEATTLDNIGGVYSDLGERLKALDYYGQALPLRRMVGDRSGEATTLHNIGRVYKDLSEQQKALEYYNQALSLERAVGNRYDEAATLGSMGAVYDDVGEKQKALDYYNQALPVQHAVGDRDGEAITLNNIGLVYDTIGEKQKALDYFNQALPLERAVGDRNNEATTLTDIGVVYDDLGEKQKALDYLNQALPLRRAVGDRSGEATTLGNIGHVYDTLGEKQKALDYFNQALPLERAVGDRSGEAGTLNNIASVYGDSGEKQKALDFYNQALLLERAVQNHEGEATVLNNIGLVFDGLEQQQKALDYYNQALLLRRALRDRSGEALELHNIAAVYFALGETQKTVDYYNQALPLERAVGYRELEAITLGNLEFTFQHTDPSLAILFGKQAVNMLQSIRRDNKGLQASLRATYEQSIETYYRFLADLLIERDRFGEAEEVLNLLKDKEASDFIRRDSVSDQLHAATLLDSEKTALDRYDRIVNQIVALGQRKAELVAKVDQAPLSTAELQEENRLDADLKSANAVLQRFFEEEQKSIPANSAQASRVQELKEAEGLQDALQKLGPDVVAIYTLVTPDKYVAMLVTSGARKAYTSTIQEAELNKKIFEFRQVLQDPSSDPLPLAQELYHIVFPESMRQDLDGMHAKTIMWSIDSTLRYIPFAALYDGKQYLVQTFRQSLITPASIPYLTEEPVRPWSGVGFGVSESTSPLPSVPAELRGIFRETADSKSPVSGVVRLNGAFTRQNFENDLRQRKNPVVHIATHFDSRPGVAANSQLLLGDGELSLADIESETRLFKGVDLLTLSACNTAFTNRSEDGREVDSFGTIAQRLGAKGVIASLWSVNDDSTAILMQTMYGLREQNPGMTKDEALRQAQLRLLTGELKSSPAQPVADRGSTLLGSEKAKTKTSAGWSHPYYWAPFILIGNWK